MATLYELTGDYQSLYEELTERDFDETLITDTIESTGLVEDIHTKAENYAIVASQLEFDATALDAEIARLQDRKRMFKANAAKIKQTLYDQLKAVGETKFKTKLYTFSTRKSQSVEISNFDKLPDEFVRVETKRSADKTTIKAAIKAGTDVEGASLVSKESLVIK